MTKIRSLLTGSITALALSATVLATATPASADWRGHRRNNGGHGGAIAAGIIGGLALGALAAGAARANTRTYYAPAPAYVPSYSYSYGGCYDVEKPVYNRWGEFRGYRLVTVCD
jgi:hypothetical protein